MQALSQQFLAGIREPKDSVATRTIKLSNFLTECEYDLRAPNGAIEVRTALRLVGCRELPKPAPTSFQSLGAYMVTRNHHGHGIFKRSNNSQRAVYPYTLNGALTSIRHQSIREILQGLRPTAYPTYKYHTNPSVLPEPGVFMENHIDFHEGNLFIATTALGACVLYSNFRNRTLKTPPIVSILGFPLPEACRNIRQLTIVAFKQAPLELPLAVHLHNTPALSGGTTIPIRVVTLDVDGVHLPSSLYEDLNAGRYTDLALHDWITQSLTVCTAIQDASLSHVAPSPMQSTLKAYYSKKTIGQFLKILNRMANSGYYGVTFNYIHIPDERAVLAEPNASYDSGPSTIVCIGDTVLLPKGVADVINTASQAQRRSLKSGCTFSTIKLQIDLDRNDLLTYVNPAYNIPYGKFWALSKRVWDLQIKQKPLELAPVTNDAPLTLRRLAEERNDDAIVYAPTVNCS